MNIDDLKQRILNSYPEIITLSPAEQSLLEAFLSTHRIQVTLSRLQKDPQYRDEYNRQREDRRRLRCVLNYNRELSQQQQPDRPSTVPGMGLLRMEEIRASYPDLSEAQLESLRKRLEKWRNLHEDDAMSSGENPETGRRRHAYPAEIVQREAERVRARAPRGKR